jgi:hypothetical protein
MQKHDDINAVISDLTELFHMINRKSHDSYITSMKQYIVNPLAWLHAEKIKRAAEISGQNGPTSQQPTTYAAPNTDGSAQTTHKTAMDEIATLANELEDFNSRCVAPYGRITDIVAKIRQLSSHYAMYYLSRKKVEAV